MAIRNQQKVSAIAVVPGVNLELNPLNQSMGSAHSLRNFVPERGRLIRKPFASTYTTTPLTATSTGDTSTGTGANFETGNTSWSSPTNITASDDSNATVSLSFPSNLTSDLLRATNYSFSLPSDAIPLGITAKIEGQSIPTGNDIVLITSQLTLNGNSIGETKSVTLLIVSESTITVGSSTDLWSIPEITASNINDSTFGIDIKAVMAGIDGSSVNIDHVKIDVAYGYPVWDIVDFSYTRSSAPEKKLIIFRSNGRVYKRSPSFEQEIFPGTTSFAVLKQKPFAGVLSNRLFFSDGTASYVYDGRDVQVWGLLNDNDVAPTTAATGTGLTMATGLKAATTWVVLDEASNRVHESSRSKVADFQVLSNENMSVDKSSQTAPARATHWSAYVSELDGSNVLRRVATTIISTDSVTVTALPAATAVKAPIRNDLPVDSTIGTVAKNRIFIRDDSNPDTYHFSALGEVLGLLNGAADESFPGNGSSSISDLSNNDFVPGREITNMVEHENFIFLFTESQGFALVGELNLLDNRATRSLVKLQQFTEGCIGHGGAVSTPFGLAWITSGRQILLGTASTGAVLDIGRSIQPILDAKEVDDQRDVSMVWYSGNGRQWLVITLQSSFEVSDGTSVVASEKRVLIYDFSLPTELFPGSWFEFVDKEYVHASVFTEPDGDKVLLLADSTGHIYQSDVIVQPGHLEFTSLLNNMYLSSTLENNPAAQFKTGLLAPAGDVSVVGHFVGISTGTQDKIESATTQPTIAMIANPDDPTESAALSLTLDSATNFGERRAYLKADSNANASGALVRTILLQANYAAGVDTLSSDNSRNKGAVNALYKFALTYSPASELSE